MKLVNFLSQIDEIRCTGCRKCETICPSAAISMAENKAQVDEKRCVACTKCWNICPEEAVMMVPRKEEMMVGVEPEEVNQEEIESLCRKAHLYPDQFICACTLTPAKEVAAAIIKGATSPEEITAMTGVRSGCAMYCMAPVLRLFKAHGVSLNPPDNHRWYNVSLSLWDIPEEIIQKYPNYYLREDKKELYE